nr:6K2 protein [Pennisetum mosaic virus]
GVDEISECLQLQGRWNAPLIQRDLMIAAGVFAGGGLMLWFMFLRWARQDVTHQ